jgi:hypothetical protein
MRSDLTDITVVLDKSGSMGRIADDVIGGFNRFVEEQAKEPGEALLSLVLFDTTYEVKYVRTPLKDVQKLTRKSYVPYGRTALLDATAQAIIETGVYLERLKEEHRPGKVVLVIMTDGHENSSGEYDLEQVQTMIKHQQEIYNWHVVFLGANIDAFADARLLRIQASNVMNFGASGQGVNCAFTSVSRGLARLRNAAGGQSCSTGYAFFSEQEQKEGEATKFPKQEQKEGEATNYTTPSKKSE